jgi:hypothetical protein
LIDVFYSSLLWPTEFCNSKNWATLAYCCGLQAIMHTNILQRGLHVACTGCGVRLTPDIAACSYRKACTALLTTPRRLPSALCIPTSRLVCCEWATMLLLSPLWQVRHDQTLHPKQTLHSSPFVTLATQPLHQLCLFTDVAQWEIPHA